MDVIEKHPHEPFVPKEASVLILGSFPGKGHSNEAKDEWYYQSKRNQFWKIMEQVYGQSLTSVEEKKNLCTQKGIAIADICLSVKRKQGHNSDANLEIISYNTKALKKMFQEHKFPKILTTSQWVAKEFMKLFPQNEFPIESLPSPSPRAFQKSIAEKVDIYRQLLPK